MIGHAAAALLLTLAIAAGILGLGAMCGGTSLLSRWVRGWTLLWWSMALTAQLVGPRTAAWWGAVATVAGVVWLAVRLRPSPRNALTAVAAVLAGAPLYLPPPVFFDTLVYHLGLPWTWLTNASYDPIPYHLFSHFPVASQTVSLTPVLLGLPEAAAGLHWCCLIVALAGIVSVARRFGAGRWARLAAPLLLGCWHVVWVAAQAANDLLVTAAFVAAVEALLVRREQPRWWLDLGLACGLAVAAKYSAGVPVAAMLVALLAVAPRLWRPLVAGGAVAAAASSFVLVRNLVATGNPLFPLFWGVLGGSGWTLRDQERWTALVREGVDGLASLPTGVVRLVLPPGGLGWWAVMALPLVLFAVAGGDEQRGERRLLAAVLLAALGGWLVTSQTTRYAFPLAVLVAVLATVGLARLGRRAAVPVAVALGLGVVHGLLGLVFFVTGGLHMEGLWSGRIGAEAWRASVTVNDPMPIWRAAGERLEPGARLLVVGEGRSWGCPLPHHVSSPYDLQQMQQLVEESRDAAEVERRVRAQGWTHLVINWGELERLGNESFQVLRWRTADDHRRWQTFLRRYTTRVATAGACEIRELSGPAAAAES